MLSSTIFTLRNKRGNGMNQLFNMENPFFQAINKFIDMVSTSFIYSLFLGPMIFMGYVTVQNGPYLLYLALFTLTSFLFGPVATGLYYAVVKVIRRERGYAIREFFRSFKLNFKQAALISLIYGFLSALLYFDYKYVIAANEVEESTMNTIMLIGFNIAVILMVLTMTYIFPVLSRFTLTIKQLFKNSLLMSIRHLPSTLLMILINGVGIFLVWGFWPFPLFCIVPAVCMLLDSLLMERIFKKYMPESEGNPEETGRDEWYLE